MTPTILIVGATGNTGRSTTSTLSSLISKSPTFSNHRILALTRSLSSPAALALAELPSVEVKEYTWSEITPEWLISNSIERAFIASHNNPNQFAEESSFHVAALNAGVRYVVRISTTAQNVHPNFKAYYPRTHWAIETMLSTPEFAAMQWTSLQPNVFSTFILGPAVAFIKSYRETGQLSTLRLMASADAAVGIIHSDDVGIFAAHLLVQPNITEHSRQKYILNGPVDISGKEIVEMVKEKIGREIGGVEGDGDVVFKDLSFLEDMASASKESRNVIMSIQYAPVTGWDGECTASTTSKRVLEIAAPKSTPREVLDIMLRE